MGEKLIDDILATSSATPVLQPRKIKHGIFTNESIGNVPGGNIAYCEALYVDLSKNTLTFCANTGETKLKIKNIDKIILVMFFIFCILS